MGKFNRSSFLVAAAVVALSIPTSASQICAPIASGASSDGARVSKHERTVMAASSAGLEYEFPSLENGYQRTNLSAIGSKKPEFIYTDSGGKKVTDPQLIQRFASLGIPPGHSQVWIAKNPQAHIQGLSYDAKGKAQYSYHPRWVELTSDLKFQRTVQFGKRLPALMGQVQSDIRRNGFSKAKVLATVTWLLQSTLIRVGNLEGVQNNESFGLTTMLKSHVISTNPVTFYFKGKSNKWHTKVILDSEPSKVVRSLLDLPGQNLFQFKDAQGSVHPISSDDVNGYIKQAIGTDFSAKDFRTWMASYHATDFLFRTTTTAAGGREGTISEKELRALFLKASEYAATHLGNTASVCRESYIHPQIFKAYAEKTPFAKAFHATVPTEDPIHNALISLLESATHSNASHAERTVSPL
ncbi:MAG: hypothetical protein K2X47_10135 [Bdellovibrionales bacterium]|nr:hypothetical protein [Bdellovibrionales bacterium]